MVVRSLLKAIEGAGASRPVLLQAVGLTPEQLAADLGRVLRSSIHQLLEAAADLTSDPAIALHWAEQIGQVTFAPVSPLLAYSSTLRHAFAMLAQFQPLLSDQPGYELVERGDEVVLRCPNLAGESARVEQLVAEAVLLGFFRLLRYFGLEARQIRVSCRYPAPAYACEYARLFENAALFEQPFSGLSFARELLDSCAPQQDAEVHGAMQALAERRLARIHRAAPYALRVREFLIRHGAPQRSDMKAVALSFGLSARSLRRRLADEGKQYSSIVSEALTIMAKQLLCDKQRTIQETAFELGFANASTFHRAFKSWTGMTPNAYQKGQR
ncbi:MAG: araC1 [Myxococcaceae bacterium]|nr:araC1 [Myxococcaceae bacterium]